MGDINSNFFEEIEMTAEYERDLALQHTEITNKVEKEIRDMQEMRTSLEDGSPGKLPLTEEAVKKYKELRTAYLKNARGNMLPAQTDYVNQLRSRDPVAFKAWDTRVSAFLDDTYAKCEAIEDGTIPADLTAEQVEEEKARRTEEYALLSGIQEQAKKPSSAWLVFQNDLAVNKARILDLKENAYPEQCDKVTVEDRRRCYAITEKTKLAEQPFLKKRDQAIAELETARKKEYADQCAKFGVPAVENVHALRDNEYLRVATAKSELDELVEEMLFVQEISQALKDSGFAETAWDLGQKNGIMVWTGRGETQQERPLIEVLASKNTKGPRVTAETMKKNLEEICKNSIVFTFQNGNQERPVQLGFDAQTGKISTEKCAIPVKPVEPPPPIPEPAPLSFLQRMGDGIMKLFGSRTDAGRAYDAAMIAYEADAQYRDGYPENLEMFSQFAKIAAYYQQEKAVINPACNLMDPAEILRQRTAPVEAASNEFAVLNGIQVNKDALADQLREVSTKYEALKDTCSKECEVQVKSLKEAADTEKDASHAMVRPQIDKLTEKLQSECEKIEIQQGKILTTMDVVKDADAVAHANNYKKTAQWIAQRQEDRYKAMVAGTYQPEDFKLKLQENTQQKDAQKDQAKDQEKNQAKDKTGSEKNKDSQL